jgi:hypothetical protein
MHMACSESMAAFTSAHLVAEVCTHLEPHATLALHACCKQLRQLTQLQRDALALSRASLRIALASAQARLRIREAYVLATCRCAVRRRCPTGRLLPCSRVRAWSCRAGARWWQRGSRPWLRALRCPMFRPGLLRPCSLERVPSRSETLQQLIKALSASPDGLRDLSAATHKAMDAMGAQTVSTRTPPPPPSAHRCIRLPPHVVRPASRPLACAAKPCCCAWRGPLVECYGEAPPSPPPRRADV